MQNLAYKSWHNITSATSLAQFAVEAAISGDWLEATKINQRILEIEKDNIEALNRLARANLCLGNEKKAQTTYEKVVKIDPYNIIAIKNIEKISKINGQTNSKKSNHNNHSSFTFLVEPGKTKIISLLNLAPPTILATLNCGDQVYLNPKKHSVCIHTQDGTYLGALPDDLAHRLINFLTGGNKYEAFIKIATTKILTIFIKEVSRSLKFINQPSFVENRLSLAEEKGTAS